MSNDFEIKEEYERRVEELTVARKRISAAMREEGRAIDDFESDVSELCDWINGLYLTADKANLFDLDLLPDLYSKIDTEDERLSVKLWNPSDYCW